jgi:hypothetical protein
MAEGSLSKSKRRPWSILIGILVVVFLLFLGLALLSEREDARRLGPERLEGVEETYQEGTG